MYIGCFSHSFLATLPRLAYLLTPPFDSISLQELKRLKMVNLLFLKCYSILERSNEVFLDLSPTYPPFNK